LIDSNAKLRYILKYKFFNLIKNLFRYALKITQLDNESVDESTFDQLNEAKLLRSLSSSYIIQYHDCFFENMRIFLVTEYCEVVYYFINFCYFL